MNLKLFRYSGRPVRPEDMIAYKQEWQQGVAALESEFGAISVENSQLFQEPLEHLENKLLIKYPNQIIVAVPTTQLRWESFFKRFNCPAVSICFEGEGLVAYLNDGVA